MRIFLLLTIMVTLAGCVGGDAQAKSLLQTVEFEGDEYGTLKVTGDVNLGGIPFFSTTVHIEYEKTKDKPET